MRFSLVVVFLLYSSRFDLAPIDRPGGPFPDVHRSMVGRGFFLPSFTEFSRKVERVFFLLLEGPTGEHCETNATTATLRIGLPADA